ncbi:MAG: hypothetical protein HRU09_08255 [Oligoflexales bacterium]|nr:hypothetical protein [Oligoflexales bacterium]
MAIHGRKRLSIFFACILLSMILSRLVWMQLRTYQLMPSISTFSAFSYVSKDFQKNCRNNSEIEQLFKPLRQEAPYLRPQQHGWFIQPSHIFASKEICAKQEPIQFIIHAHWVCLTLIVMLGIFLARFLSSSWCLAIFVGATLMSRGALLALIGSYSEMLPITLLMTLWFTSCIHYMRTLSGIALTSALATMVLGSLHTGSFIALGLTIPLFILILRNKAPSSSEGSLARSKAKVNSFIRAFSPLRVRFSLWIDQSPQLRKRLVLVWIILTALLAFTQLIFKSYQLFYSGIEPDNPVIFKLSTSTFWSFISQWSQAGIQSLDLHSALSIAIIAIWGLSSYVTQVHVYTKEAVIFFLLCFATLTGACFMTGYLDYIILDSTQLRARAFSQGALHPTPFLVWLEPIILTLGIIGLYHMLKRKTVSLEA